MGCLKVKQEEKLKKKEKEQKQALLVKWRSATAEQVQSHINSINEADDQFWGYYNCYKNDGLWADKLSKNDFAVLFTDKNKDKQ